MGKVLNWLFTQTSIGKLLDGKKRYIGLILWLLAWILEGVLKALEFFPETQWLQGTADLLQSFIPALSDFLKDLGYGFLIVGTGAAALKEKN